MIARKIILSTSQSTLREQWPAINIVLLFEVSLYSAAYIIYTVRGSISIVYKLM